MTVIALERAEISRTLAASDFRRLCIKWEAEAARHERAAEDIFEKRGDMYGDDENANDREERMIHLEVARVLRSCSRDLFGA